MTQQKGSNASGIRRFNERLILTMLSKHGPQSKTELAQLTNLTTQAVMRIVDELFDQELILLESQRIRGKGRPSGLYIINPKGAFSFGVMVGRREIKIVLMDIAGHIIADMQESYNYPEPTRILDIIVSYIAHLLVNLDAKQHHKIRGIGVAMPWFLGRWSDGQEMPNEVAQTWDSFNLYDHLKSKVDFPVHISNDCTSAAAAELLFGQGKRVNNYLYAYIDSFIGGGLVLKGNIENGAHANSAAIASYPVKPSNLPYLSQYKRPFEILLNRASLMSLLDYLRHKGETIENLAQLQQSIDQDAIDIEEWLDDCSHALAELAVGASVLLDYEALIVDINLTGPLLNTIIERTEAHIANLIERDVYRPKVLKGVLNKNAIVVGGGILPFYFSFMADKSVLFKPD